LVDIAKDKACGDEKKDKKKMMDDGKACKTKKK